jgi:tetratricopeptide (TPR) repeat protein
MENNLASTLFVAIISGIIQLILEYYVFKPLSRGTTADKKSVRVSRIIGLLLILGFSSIIYKYFGFLPQILNCFANIFIVVTITMIVLFVHNHFYGVTFQVLIYGYQYIIRNYDGAFRTLHLIKQIRPNDPFPYVQQAIIHLKKKQYPLSLNEIDNAIELGGESLYLLKIKNRLFWEWVKDWPNVRENWKKLRHTIRKILLLTPKDIELHYDLAEVDFYLGNYSTGIESLKTLVNTLTKNIKESNAKRTHWTNRRKLWTLIDVQKNVIELLNDALSNFPNPSVDTSRLVRKKIRDLAKAVQKISGYNVELNEVHKNLADVFFSVGWRKTGSKFLRKYASEMRNEAIAHKRNSRFYEVVRLLWYIVDVQEKEIELLERLLIEKQ